MVSSDLGFTIVGDCSDSFPSYRIVSKVNRSVFIRLPPIVRSNEAGHKFHSCSSCRTHGSAGRVSLLIRIIPESSFVCFGGGTNGPMSSGA